MFHSLSSSISQPQDSPQSSFISSVTRTLVLLSPYAVTGQDVSSCSSPSAQQPDISDQVGPLREPGTTEGNIAYKQKKKRDTKNSWHTSPGTPNYQKRAPIVNLNKTLCLVCKQFMRWLLPYCISRLWIYIRNPEIMYLEFIVGPVIELLEGAFLCRWFFGRSTLYSSGF